MYSFRNDYSEGVHPRILNALVESNMEQEEGYGLDRHTAKAVELIKELVDNQECGVHLLAGGTMTNLIAIGAFLRPHEACIAAETGHIATHETGAIEATGHKIITTHAEDGKLTPALIEPILIEHHFEHMVKPKLVYISNTTELGTVYTKKELEELHTYCQSKELILYCDGARLGSALAVKESELTLKDMSRLTDAFFIGGTKIGALLGEALVINNEQLQKEFRYSLKQRGGLMAKGRILGIQFEELFTDDLFGKLANHSNRMAQQLAKGLAELGCSFLIDSPSNQVFPIMDNQVIEELSKVYGFYVWKPINEKESAIRLITSWATQEEAVTGFIKAYKELVKE